MEGLKDSRTSDSVCFAGALQVSVGTVVYGDIAAEKSFQIRKNLVKLP